MSWYYMQDQGWNPTAAVSKLGQFNSPHIHLVVSFGRDTESHWSLQPFVYARGSGRSHTRGKCVTCHGLTISKNTNK